MNLGRAEQKELLDPLEDAGFKANSLCRVTHQGDMEQENCPSPAAAELQQPHQKAENKLLSQVWGLNTLSSGFGLTVPRIAGGVPFYFSH